MSCVLPIIRVNVTTLRHYTFELDVISNVNQFTPQKYQKPLINTSQFVPVQLRYAVMMSVHFAGNVMTLRCLVSRVCCALLISAMVGCGGGGDDGGSSSPKPEPAKKETVVSGKA
jgi:hypothetical protein